MAYNFGWKGPKISKNGLILYFDTSSPNSFYDKNSSLLRDISGSSYNCTVFNRPSFLNNGLRLNGTNQYISIPTHPMGTGMTLSFWINVPSGGVGTIIGDGSQSDIVGFIWIYMAYANGIQWQFATNTVRGALDDPSLFTGVFDTWINIVFVGDYSNPNAVTLSIYRNGVYRTGVTAANIQIPVSRTRLVGSYNGLSFMSNSTIGSYYEYNRALSAAEILSNYNNSRSRYNV